MIVKQLTEHHLEFLSLKGGCRGSSESTLVKMSNCWKSHAAAQLSSVACLRFLLVLISEGNINDCSTKLRGGHVLTSAAINNSELPSSYFKIAELNFYLF